MDERSVVIRYGYISVDDGLLAIVEMKKNSKKVLTNGLLFVPLCQRVDRANVRMMF